MCNVNLLGRTCAHVVKPVGVCSDSISLIDSVVLGRWSAVMMAIFASEKLHFFWTYIDRVKQDMISSNALICSNHKNPDEASVWVRPVLLRPIVDSYNTGWNQSSKRWLVEEVISFIAFSVWRNHMQNGMTNRLQYWSEVNQVWRLHSEEEVRGLTGSCVNQNKSVIARLWCTNMYYPALPWPAIKETGRPFNQFGTKTTIWSRNVNQIVKAWAKQPANT